MYLFIIVSCKIILLICYVIAVNKSDEVKTVRNHTVTLFV